MLNEKINIFFFSLSLFLSVSLRLFVSLCHFVNVSYLGGFLFGRGKGRRWLANGVESKVICGLTRHLVLLVLVNGVAKSIALALDTHVLSNVAHMINLTTGDHNVRQTSGKRRVQVALELEELHDCRLGGLLAVFVESLVVAQRRLVIRLKLGDSLVGGCQLGSVGVIGVGRTASSCLLVLGALLNFSICPRRLLAILGKSCLFPVVRSRVVRL